MPYRSVAQQKWMHANHPKIAKKWDKLTDFKNLPDKVDEDVNLPEANLGDKPWSPKEHIANLGNLKKAAPVDKKLPTVSRLRTKHKKVCRYDTPVKPMLDPKNQLQEDAFLSDKTAENTVETEPAKSKAPDTKLPKKPTDKNKSFPLDTEKKSPTPANDAKKKFVTPINPKGSGKAAQKATPSDIPEKSPVPVKGKKTLSITEIVRGIVREALSEIVHAKKTRKP